MLAEKTKYNVGKFQYVIFIIFTFIICLFIFLKGMMSNDKIIYDDNNFSRANKGLYVENEGLYIDEKMFESEQKESIDIDFVFDLLLKKGSYDVIIDYESSENNDSIYFTWGQDTYKAIKVDRINLDEKHTQITTCAWVDDSRSDFIVGVKYSKKGKINIKNIKIVRNMKRELNQIVKIIFLSMSLMSLIYFRTLSKRNNNQSFLIFLALGMLVFISSIILMTDYLQWNYDLEYHLMRIEGLAAEIQSGHFPARISAEWFEGYGYASSIMYCDTFLLIPAILRICGFTVMGAYKAYVFFINILTCFVAFYSIKIIVNDTVIGLIGSMMYTLSSFRIFEVYRHSVGEATAMSFLPLIICGLYLIIESEREDNRERERSRRKGIIYCILGYSGCIQSHIITTFLVAIFTLIFVILFLKYICKKNIILSLCKVVVGTLLVNLWWIVPFLDYLISVPFKVANQSLKIQKTGVQIANLLLGFDLFRGEGRDSDWGMYFRFSLNLGLPLLLGIGLFILLSNDFKYDIRKEKHWRYTKSCMLIGLVATAMTTIYFPYDLLMDWTGSIGKLFGNIQFSWRILSIAVVCLSMASCGVLCILKRRISHNLYSIVLCLLAMMIVLPYFYQVTSRLKDDGSYVQVYDKAGLNSYAVVQGEYLPNDTNLDLLDYSQYILPDSLSINSFEKENTSINISLENKADKDVSLELPLINYKGYVAKNMETGNYLDINNGFNSVVEVVVPAKFNGGISIYFEPLWYWKLSEIVSILFIFYMIARYCIARKKIDKRIQGK